MSEEWSELETLLRRVDPTVLKRLERLDEDLADDDAPLPSPESIPAWLNPDALGARAEHELGRRARKWERGRTILVMGPLIVTWASLGLAVWAFGYVAQHHLVDTKRAFLDLWQAGFDGKFWFPIPTFAHVAVMDVILLLGLLVCSVMAHIFRQRADDDAELLRQMVEQRLFALLRQVEASRMIRAHRQLREALAPTFDAPSRALHDLIADIQRQRERIDELGARRERELGELAGVAADLKEGGGALVTHAGRLGEVATLLSAATVELTSSAGSLGGLRADLHGTVEDLAKRTVDLAGALRSVMTGDDQLRASLNELNVRLVEHSSSLAARYEAVDRLAEERAAELTKMAETLATRHAELIGQIDKLAGRVPEAPEIAEQVTKVWSEAQAAHLDAINGAVAGSLAGLAEGWKRDVIDPVLTSPLVVGGARRVEELNGAVARLDGVMADVHRDAQALGAALLGLAAFLKAPVDDRRDGDGHRGDGDTLGVWLDVSVRDR